VHEVDFFIVWQPKSGTTALAHFLNSHPKIGISNPKEPAYFATDLREESDQFQKNSSYFIVRTPKQYEEIFKESKGKQYLGEASTNYLYSKDAAKNILEYNPDAKIIIMLRNPVDFMHSLHMQYVNVAVEDEEDFELALALEPKRQKSQSLPGNTIAPSYYFYSKQADYLPQIKRYFSTFPRKNILVIITEEFQKDNKAVYKQVIDFLGIENNQYYPEFKVVHGSKKPRFSLLNKIVNNRRLKSFFVRMMKIRFYARIGKKISSLMMTKAPRKPMDTELRTKLNRQFKPKVQKIGQFIDRDLSGLWLRK